MVENERINRLNEAYKSKSDNSLNQAVLGARAVKSANLYDSAAVPGERASIRLQERIGHHALHTTEPEQANNADTTSTRDRLQNMATRRGRHRAETQPDLESLQAKPSINERHNVNGKVNTAEKKSSSQESMEKKIVDWNSYEGDDRPDTPYKWLVREFPLTTYKGREVRNWSGLGDNWWANTPDPYFDQIFNVMKADRLVAHPENIEPIDADKNPGLALAYETVLLDLFIKKREVMDQQDLPYLYRWFDSMMEKGLPNPNNKPQPKQDIKPNNTIKPTPQPADNNKTATPETAPVGTKNGLTQGDYPPPPPPETLKKEQERLRQDKECRGIIESCPLKNGVRDWSFAAKEWDNFSAEQKQAVINLQRADQIILQGKRNQLDVVKFPGIDRAFAIALDDHSRDWEDRARQNIAEGKLTAQQAIVARIRKNAWKDAFYKDVMGIKIKKDNSFMSYIAKRGNRGNNFINK